MKPKLQVLRILTQPFAENTYLAYFRDSGHCVVIDPGFEPDEILSKIRQEKLIPLAILNTHGHADHIAGNEALKRCYPDIPLLIGERDAPKLSDPQQNLSGVYGFGFTSPPADQLLVHNQRISLLNDNLELEVRDTPGHSCGHVVFIYRGESPWIVFGGDVLFAGGIGRTDFPDGSFEQLEQSIRTQLYTLPDDTIVLPGHGDPTTIGEEKLHNPYVAAFH